MDDGARGPKTDRKKAETAKDVDSLLRLVTRLVADGHNVRRLRVGEVEVELGNRPVRVEARDDERPARAQTYAQRALDSRERELERMGAIQKPRA